jgi:tetratricopeptide (TPR) repeat protein
MIAETQNRIQAALHAQDFETAARVANMAVTNGEVHETLFQLAALHHQGVGDLTAAANMLLKAVELAPHDPGILTAAADVLRQVGQLQRAILLFDDAIFHDGTMVAAWYGRALALEAAGALGAARDSYQRVTELAPSTAPGFAGLSTTSVQLDDKEAGRRFAVQAYAIAPEDPAACMALARCEMAVGNFAEAVKLLRRTALDQVDLLTLLGDALDRLGSFDEAFDAYVAANHHFAQMHGGSAAPQAICKRLDDIGSAVAALGSVDWSVSTSTQPRAAAGHVFLLGYPRSGTTLVEQALASLPNVVTLEEAPTLDDAQTFLTREGVAQLSTLSELAIDDLRAAYWRRVADHGIDVVSKIFIDMDPSKSMGLPVIARLFPDAKIIVMRRDPRDVIWSCFRHAFVYSPMTFEFSSLDRASRHYDVVMRLTQTCLKALPVNHHILVYEDLVRDFDTTTRALCDFIGIPWSADMRDFGATARAGRVRTASADQVRKSLYDGSGQWRNYAHKLTHILPRLEPWVDSRASSNI